MPGVNVSTAARSGGPSTSRAPSGRYFVVGQAERGSTVEPVRLRGMADYETLLGARVSYGSLYDDLRLFFEEGGVEAYVARVVGTAATTGTLTLTDRAGSPVNTLKVDAASQGAWSSGLTAEVQDGALSNTFRIIVRLDGVVVQDKNNLSSPSQAAVQFAGSPYVKVTDMGSATSSPNNNPKVLAATALSAGADDRGTINAASYTSALSRFTQGYGDGAVAIPGQGTGVHAGLISHAKDNRRIALLSLAKSQDSTAYTTAAVGLASTTGADAAGLFGPWVAVTDDAGGYRYISPEGYIAGARARAHETVGPWRAPAGEIAASRSILGLETEWTRTQGDALDAARVSVIRRVGGRLRLYGWRSLSSDEDNYYFLSARDVLNRLVVEGETRLETYVFSPIDAKGQLLAAVNASLIGIVEPMKQANGLYPLLDVQGNEIDPGYRVETGSSVNSAQSLALNQIKARLSVRVAPTGALVELTIVKVGPLAGL